MKEMNENEKKNKEENNDSNDQRKGNIKKAQNPGQSRATSRPDTRQTKPPPQLHANALLPREKAAT